MNRVILMGRLTRDPNVRYSSDTIIANFALAVDRRFKRDGEKEADFFSCVAFGKLAEVVEKYLKQGSKILLVGRIQNDNYTNREGRKVYSVQVIAEEIEFAESRNAGGNNAGGHNNDNGHNGYAPSDRPANTTGDGFMDIPDGDDEIPFN